MARRIWWLLVRSNLDISSAFCPAGATVSEELLLPEACRDELIFCSRPLQDLLGIHRLSAHHTAPGSGPGLITIAECHQPLLLEIVGFLAGTPRDFVHFGAIASCAIARQVDFVVRDVWRDLYARTSQLLEVGFVELALAPSVLSASMEF